MRSIRFSFFVLPFLGSSLLAQAPAPGAAKPSFEVASVKPNKSGDRGMSSAEQPGGRFIVTNMPLATLVRNAFDLQESQLVGLPDWGSSERFDIVAKAEQEFPRTNERPRLAQRMMQSLLEERFKLVSHRETRELPAYALVLARTDGRLGPQLKQSDVDCAALAAARRAAGAAPAGGGVSASTPSAPPPPGQRRQCTMTMAGGTLRAGSVPIASLIATLSSVVQRIVVDRTGLTGGFDFDLAFSTEQSADATSPSVFTAVQEQLGLKLDSVRVPMDVLVVDSVERPTPD
jgi:uncharacterized protein (TIGR03435 family)